MGAGASGGSLGVATNPRLELADEETCSYGKLMTLDSSSLVKLEHGTLRYREIEGVRQPKLSKIKSFRPKEKPHEGPERANKWGYFYHSKLHDFSQDASYEKEHAANFCYVSGTPKKAQLKKVYYVAEIGQNDERKRIENNDSGGQQVLSKDEVVKSEKKRNTCFSLENTERLFRFRNHVIFNLYFGEPEKDFHTSNENINEENAERNVSTKQTIFHMPESSTEKPRLKSFMTANETVGMLCMKISSLINKTPDNINVLYNEKYVASNELVANLYNGSLLFGYHHVIYLSAN